MKAKFLAAMYAGIVVYCALSALFGTAGARATRDLELQYDAMQDNLHELASKTARLEARLESVRSDPETLRLEARSLGYVAAGEGVISLPSSRVEEGGPDPGVVISVREPGGRSDAWLKAVSGIASALVFSIALVLFPSGRRQPRAKIRAERRFT